MRIPTDSVEMYEQNEEVAISSENEGATLDEFKLFVDEVVDVVEELVSDDDIECYF